MANMCHMTPGAPIQPSTCPAECQEVGVSNMGEWISRILMDYDYAHAPAALKMEQIMKAMRGDRCFTHESKLCWLLLTVSSLGVDLNLLTCSGLQPLKKQFCPDLVLATCVNLNCHHLSETKAACRLRCYVFLWFPVSAGLKMAYSHRIAWLFLSYCPILLWFQLCVNNVSTSNPTQEVETHMDRLAVSPGKSPRQCVAAEAQ